MKYADLDERAQQKAREKWAEDELDTGWWESTYEDAVTIGELMGIDVDTNVARTVGGHPIKQYDISFSGFCSQGDGACWSGRVNTIQFAGAVARIVEHCPQDEIVKQLAEQAEVINVMLVTHQVAMRLTVPTDEFDEYECVPDMVLTVKGDERGYATRINTDVALPIEIEKALDKFVDDFAGWLYRNLETESEYRLDDEQIVASIEAADADFDEDGDCL